MSQYPPAPGQPADEWMKHVEWRPFSFANAFEQGWYAFKANYVLALVGTLAAGGIAFAAGMVGQVISAGVSGGLGAAGGGMGSSGRAGGPPVALALGGALFSMVLSLTLAVLVQWPSYASLGYVGVAVVRSEPVTGRNILRGFHKYPRAIMAMLWIFLLLLAMCVPIGLIMGCAGVGLGMSKAGVGGGLLLVLLIFMLIIPVMYVLLRIYPGVTLAMDDHVHGLSTLDCIKTSWEITKASSWEYFALMVVVYLMNIVGVFLLCFPAIFFTGPLAIAIIGAAYHQLAFDAGMFKSRHVCRNCGYPLQPGMGVCPECGHNTSAATNINPTGTPPIGPGMLPPQDPFSRDPFGPRP